MIEDDESAFPIVTKGMERLGMSLRDYFAGQALLEFASLITVSKPGTLDTVAELCFKMADAMMAARKVAR